jgi:hypothetical protein
MKPYIRYDTSMIQIIQYGLDMLIRFYKKYIFRIKYNICEETLIFDINKTIPVDDNHNLQKSYWQS